MAIRRYNAYFLNQLREILTGYGEIAQVWFDGANGEGPNGKRQVYDWEAYYRLIRELQPDALISITGPDVRWVGNESGVAREDESSVQERDGAEVWWPAECDVSIRPGWFYHAAEDGAVRSVENLVGLYFQSVGRNSVFLLNVPPDRDGLFAAPDVAVLEAFGRQIEAIFTDNLAATATLTASSVAAGYRTAALTDGDPDSFWAATTDDPAVTLTVEFAALTTFDVVRLREPIRLGERSRGFRVWAKTGEGWVTIAEGAVIGNDRCFRVAPITARRVRVTFEASRGQTLLSEFGLYTYPPVCV